MALALKSNITQNYRKLGKRPRIYIRIPSANIFIGTSLAQLAGVDYTDSIAEFDTITQSIEKYGGMAEVSSFGVRNLQLGSRFTLCTEAALTPQLEGYAGAGRLYAQGVADYAAARNATAASDMGSPAIVIGRRNIAGIPIYQVIRSYLQFAIPSGITSCEEATIEMTGVNRQTYQAFNIQMALGSWATLINGISIFNDLSGWASSGSYTITDLGETWPSSEYSYGTVNKIRMNTAGKAQVVAKTGETLKLMLLSSLDASNAAAPSYDEYCQFDISGVVLRLRYNTVTLDNQDAEVYLAYEPIPSSYTDMQLIWKGVVDDYSLDKSSLNLKLKQNDHKKNVIVPKNIITIEDFPNCPDENLGKAFPLVYGDFSTVRLSEIHKDSIGKETDGSPYSGIRDYIKGVVVNNGGFDQNNPLEMKLSEHVLKDISNAGAASWLSNNNTYARVWGQVSLNSTPNTVHFLPTLILTSSIARDTDIAGATYKNYGGLAVSVIPNDVYDNNGVTYPERAYSSLTSEFAEILNAPDWFELSFPKIANSGTIDRAEIVFDLVDNNVGGGSDVQVGIRKANETIRVDNGVDGVFTDTIEPYKANFASAAVSFTTSGVVAGDYLYVKGGVNRGRYRIESVDTAHLLTVICDSYAGIIIPTSSDTFRIGYVTAEITHFHVADTGQKQLDITDPASDGNLLGWDIENYLIRFTYNAVAPVFNSFEIKNVQIRYYTSDIEKAGEYYFDSEGVYDDNAGTITGVAGTVLEKPAHVIESFARDDMLLTAAEINTTAFDAANTALSSWKYAFQITDRQGARTLLHNFFRQCRSKGLWDEQDRLSIKTFSASNHFSVSGTDTPTGLDIFDTTGTPYLDQVTTNPIMDLQINRTGLDEVKNDFVLKYRKNYATGEYLETLYMTNGLGIVGDVETNLSDSYLENSQTVAALSALCASSYAQYQTTNTLEFEADCIRDIATASKLLQYLIERMWKRRYMPTVTTLDTGVRIEEGDFVNIRDTRINDLFGETTANLKKWEVLRKIIGLNNMHFTFETIEVD